MAAVSRGSEGPQIATLVARSLASFKALTSTLQDDHARASQASSCLARFKLWAGNLGAHRPSGSRSLEYRLRDASHIRKLVISFLQDLCSSIEQGTLVASGGSIPDTSSEGHDSVEDDLADYFNDDEGPDKSEIEQILDGIAHVVDCLLRLSVTIRNPAPHDQFLSRAGAGLVKSSVYWDARHVRDKFTNVDTDLADRLGRAMARRRQYFNYREEHKSRLASGLDEDEVEFGERATTIASSLPEHLKQTGENTKVGADQLAVLDDSRSDASGTTYATASPDSTQLRVPPIPKEHSEGSFKCPFCHMIVSIDTRHAWKKHVFRDLRPYVCLSQACQTPDHLYLRRNDWAMHMKREHWKTWHCPFGCSEEFDSAKGFQNHINTAHKQDVSPENIHMLEGLSSRPDVRKARGQCPLCCDFLLGSEKHYEKHVGQHLEDLALFTLPDRGEGSEDDEGDEVKEEEEADEEDADEYRYVTDESGSRSNEDLRDGEVKNVERAILDVREMLENLKAKGPAITEDVAEKLAEFEEQIRIILSPEEKVRKAEVVRNMKDVVTKLEEPLRKEEEATTKASEELKQEIGENTDTELEEAKRQSEQLPIRFKDAVGRKFSFPFHLCNTIRHHPFDDPTLSSSKKKIPPPKLNTFIYTQLDQNKSYLNAVASIKYRIDRNFCFWSHAVEWGT